MSRVGEPCSPQLGQHGLAWRQVGDTSREIAVCRPVTQECTDLRDDLAEVDVVPPAHESVVRNADIEESDPAPRANDTSDLDEEGGQVEEIAKRETAGDSVDGMVGNRKTKNVGLHSGHAAPVGREHPEAQIGGERTQTCTNEVDAQVTRSARQIEHRAAGGECEFSNRTAPPPHVEAERHDPVDEVITGGDRVEHLPDCSDLVVAFRQRVAVPGSVAHPREVTAVCRLWSAWGRYPAAGRAGRAVTLCKSCRMTSQLCAMGATELAGLIARREVSSVEVVRAHLERIEEVNPRVNAIVRRLDESALGEAAAADRAVAEGKALGPFHGVPMTVKENIDVAGTPTTNAVTALAEFMTTTDAPVVERMRSAGAIPVGRTNLPDFGLRVVTESSLHGITRNPWNRDITAGGSSGGEAVALATGMSPIGLGNDLGGSLRNPAHCCGIASIKPSSGLVPSASELPPADGPIMMQLMSVEGVMARRVSDVRAGLLTVAGPHVRDPKALPVSLIQPVSGRPLRVAVVAEPPGGDTDPGIARSIRAAADALSDAGVDVVEACPETYERAVELWSSLLIADIRELLPMLELVLGADARTFLRYAEEITPESTISSFSAGLTERSAVERDFHRFLHDHDAILSPTWAMPAFPHGADVASLEGGVHTLATMRPVLPANLLGLPAAVVPVGLSDGLPVGAQLTSRRFGDLVALQVAELIESMYEPRTPIDPTWD